MEFRVGGCRKARPKLLPFLWLLHFYCSLKSVHPLQKPMNRGFAISDWSADLTCRQSAVADMLSSLLCVPPLQKPMNHGFAISDWSADLATAGAAMAAASGEREAAAAGSHAAGGSSPLPACWRSALAVCRHCS